MIEYTQVIVEIVDLQLPLVNAFCFVHSKSVNSWWCASSAYYYLIRWHFVWYSSRVRRDIDFLSYGTPKRPLVMSNSCELAVRFLASLPSILLLWTACLQQETFIVISNTHWPGLHNIPYCRASFVVYQDVVFTKLRSVVTYLENPEVSFL